MKIQQMSHALKVMRDKYGLDATDLNKVIFTNKTSDGQLRYNNYYSGLSLSSDGTIWLGTIFGLLKVTIN